MPGCPLLSAPAVDPAQVQSLVEFGFPEANVRAALAATNGNPDMAYALLESGMPVSQPSPKRSLRYRGLRNGP